MVGCHTERFGRRAEGSDTNWLSAKITMILDPGAAPAERENLPGAIPLAEDQAPGWNRFAKKRSRRLSGSLSYGTFAGRTIWPRGDERRFRAIVIVVVQALTLLEKRSLRPSPVQASLTCIKQSDADISDNRHSTALAATFQDNGRDSDV
jgi:hypothetical protein